MKYYCDLHTHSIVSGHAYSTLLENVKEAAKNGIKVLGTSEHGPSMPGGPHIFYINNLTSVPREIDHVTVLRGCEANILDFDGNIDIPQNIQEKLDYLIVSLHDVCIRPGNRDQNTKAIISAIDKNVVDILGHCGNNRFPIWEEEVIKKAKEKDIIIEINNGSFKSRKGSEEICVKIARLCVQYGVKMILSSDSHICFDIGKFDKAERVIKEAQVPEELIMNSTEDKIIKYLKDRGRLLDL